MSKKKITAEQIDDMLFWYVVYDGNYNKVGNHVGRNRKVVRDIALQHNFDTKAHLLRDKVNEHFYGTSNPVKSRLVKMGLMIMDTEERMLKEAYDYVSNKRRVTTRFRHMPDAVAVIKHVEETITRFTGERDLRGHTLEEISKNKGADYGLTVENLLEELDDEDADEVKKILLERQRARILEGPTLAKD